MELVDKFWIDDENSVITERAGLNLDQREEIFAVTWWTVVIGIKHHIFMT